LFSFPLTPTLSREERGLLRHSPKEGEGDFSLSLWERVRVREFIDGYSDIYFLLISPIMDTIVSM